jgi:hypothetical protein
MAKSRLAYKALETGFHTIWQNIQMRSHTSFFGNLPVATIGNMLYPSAKLAILHHRDALLWWEF